MPSEEERAVEYRRMMTARLRNKRAIERGLRGNTTTAAALLVKTEPLLMVDKDGVPRGDV